MSAPKAQTAPTGFSPGRTHGIIAALDLPTTAAVRDIVTATRSVPGVVGYKLGQASVLELGLPAAAALVSGLSDLPVVYDHQKAGLDIPSNAANFAGSLRAAGVGVAVVFPVAGPRATVDYLVALRLAGVLPLVGGLLPIADYTVSGGGWVSDEVLLDITRISLEHNETHLIVPAGPAIGAVLDLTASRGVRPRLFVPGITADGAELGALSAAAGRVAGLYPIVGRALTAATDPGTAAQRLVAALDDAVAAGGGIA